jgi:hypothetical protein
VDGRVGSAEVVVMLCGQGLEAVGDGAVSVLGGVLIDQCGTRTGVAEADHELLGGGADLGGHCCPGVAEVMKVNRGMEPGGAARIGPGSRPVGTAGDAASGAAEQRGVEVGGDPGIEVLR